MAKSAKKSSTKLLAAANGRPMIKRLKKKSFLVIRAPGTKKFADTTKVKTVTGSSASGTSNFDVSKEELYPLGNATQLHLCIKGTKGSRAVTDPPEAGDLTITLENQGGSIEPTVSIPVFFIEEFDEDPPPPPKSKPKARRKSK